MFSASMPMKCMDQTPMPPRAIPAMPRFTQLCARGRPGNAWTRLAADSAANAPTTEITYDRAMRPGL